MVLTIKMREKIQKTKHCNNRITYWIFLWRIHSSAISISLKHFMNLSYTNTHKRPSKHLTFNSGV